MVKQNQEKEVGNYMNKTVIITGVTGQAGSYFSDFLLEKGFKVIGTIRRLSVPNHKNIKHLEIHPNFVLELMDLGDHHSIDNLISKYKPDYFINCSANSFVGSSWECPEQHIEYNTLGVLRQLESIRKISPTTRYINFGSSEEFGDVQYSPQDENHPPRARSPYAASKIAARQIIKVYRESYGLYALQCWCFNYESPRRGIEFLPKKITSGVARIIKAIENKENFDPIKIGSLDSKRDWSHCKDIIDGVWRMLNQEQFFNNSSYNLENTLPKIVETSLLSTLIKEYVLASGETTSIRNFIERAFKSVGIEGYWHGKGENEQFHIAEYLLEMGSFKNYTLVAVDPKFYRPADVNLLLGNSEKARKELNWEPKITLDNLIKEMVEYDINDSKRA
jgi:GDPmannose 4,6-dehydratase